VLNDKKRDLVRDGLERVEQAADFLKISRAQMWNLVRRGDVRTVRIGRSVRIPKQALVDFAASRLTEKAS